MDAVQRRGGWCEPSAETWDYSLRSRHPESAIQSPCETYESHEALAQVGVDGRVRYQAQEYDSTLQRGRRVRQPGWYRG